MMIVKIGGGSGINHAEVIADLATLARPMILVHGANALRNDLADALGKPIRRVTSISGYESVFSDENAIDLLMMAYAGLSNKRLVALCQQHGINAVGLSGLDGKTVVGRRNRGIKTMQNGKKVLLRDFSGKPKAVNTDLLKLLLGEGYTPVLSVPIIDENGNAINTENDEIVALLQRELQADCVVQLIEAPGLMGDPSDSSSLISNLSAEELELWEQRVEGRMRRKILALKKLCDSGRPAIHICDGRVERPVSRALAGEGTVIR